METSQHRGVLLLAEDEPDIREAVTELLVEFDFEVVAVADGVEALEWLRTSGRKPSLILLDWMMPRMSGDEFLRVLRQQDGLDAIPVVVLSASAKVPLNIGHIAKPFSVETLLAAVEKHHVRRVDENTHLVDGSGD